MIFTKKKAQLLRHKHYNITVIYQLINFMCFLFVSYKQFYSNLTCPLLEIIQLFKRNQDELFNIIKKKDLEIAEYILEGGNITQSWYTVK